jgi:HSP20 family protein
MLMRTDPFGELDRCAQSLLTTPGRPAAMPVDAYRHGDAFVVQAGSIDVTVFTRGCSPGEGLDAEHIDADYSAGVLTLRLPVAEHARPRKIQISTQDKVPAAIAG